jgi:hypothetical protein
LKDKDLSGKAAKPTVRNAVLRYYSLLLMLARRAEPGPPLPGAPAPAGLGPPELAAWLRDECCRVLGLQLAGGAEDAGAGGEARRPSGSEAEGALEGLSAAMGLLPVRRPPARGPEGGGCGRAAARSAPCTPVPAAVPAAVPAGCSCGCYRACAGPICTVPSAQAGELARVEPGAVQLAYAMLTELLGGSGRRRGARAGRAAAAQRAEP